MSGWVCWHDGRVYGRRERQRSGRCIRADRRRWNGIRRVGERERVRDRLRPSCQFSRSRRPLLTHQKLGRHDAFVENWSRSNAAGTGLLPRALDSAAGTKEAQGRINYATLETFSGWNTPQPSSLAFYLVTCNEDEDDNGLDTAGSVSLKRLLGPLDQPWSPFHSAAT